MFFFLVLPIFLFGCSKGNGPVDKVMNFEADDAKMNTAIAKAKSTIATFQAALKSPKPGQVGFAIKVPFEDKGETEHFWLSKVSFDGKQFNAMVDNIPEKVKSVRAGESVKLDPVRISDWMFIDNGKLVGGYTLRVMRDSLSPKEREDFDKSLPFKID